MKALLIGRGKTGVEGAQLEGFSMYERSLKAQLDLTTERVDLPKERHSLGQIEELVKSAHADVVMVMTSFQESAEELIATFRRLYERPNRPKLIYLDYFAQTSSPYFGVLPYVDRYVKRQLLRDRSLYENDYEGGYIFTDYFKRRYNFDLGSWHFGSKLPKEHAHKLVLGWNLAVVNEYRWVLRANRAFPKNWRNRPYDVNTRISLGGRDPWEWYQEYRKMSAEAAGQLATKLVISPGSRISKREFLLELRRSKMVFSPFGWGELCFRDYEAVIWGALLVKPSMEHVETRPDIFHRGVGYVALEWDHADLEEKCRYYLAHPDEAEQIIEQAQRMMSNYYEQGGFVADVQRVLTGI